MIEDVHLVHDALPDMSVADVDLTTEVMGRKLSAPLLIGAITGGAAAVRQVNLDLARAASDLGIGMQLGSQRAMMEIPKLTSTYDVRKVAPRILLLGNIGLAQARRLTDAQARALVDDIGADGLCIHLNPAMELFQLEGERDFKEGAETIERFARLFGDRLIVKETGCGISREVGKRLCEAGVQWVDVAGAGGTSWVKTELLRASRKASKAVHLSPDAAQPFVEWGIPTAASLCELRNLSCRTIASGGLRSGVDIAKALALGASAGSAALPFLRAQQATGSDGVRLCGRKMIEELKAACLLTGSRSPAHLRQAPVLITGRLREWCLARRVMDER
jgi:isopentenyl-diphosphate Delta-isomerase